MSAPASPQATRQPEPGRGVSVVVDARGLRQSGIGRYLREMLRRLLPRPEFGRFILAGDPAELGGFLAGVAGGEKGTVVPFEHAFYSPAAHLHWGMLAASGELRADVAYFPHYDVPLTAGGTPAVVVVHDLIHFRLPQYFPLAKRVAASAVLARAVRQSEAVVVLAGATRRDLLERHPSAGPRLHVIPNGVSGDLASGEASATVGGRPVESLRPFLLCVGNRKPHKNFRTAVEVLARLREQEPALRLVVVGQGFEGDGVRERARALGVADAVVELIQVSDAELLGLYRAAEVLLFPSLYEGFGLPLLEAMAVGLPVVASDRASIPEVVGDAGIVVGAEDAEGMAAAVARVRGDAALRARLVEAGRRRAAELTWDASADRMAALLLKVARSRQDR